VTSFYFEDRVEPVSPAELAAAHHAHAPSHEAVEAEAGDRALTAGN
jgi:ubiquinol-cytochrome c reductase cytochrome b subunit